MVRGNSMQFGGCYTEKQPKYLNHGHVGGMFLLSMPSRYTGHMHV